MDTFPRDAQEMVSDPCERIYHEVDGAYAPEEMEARKQSRVRGGVTNVVSSRDNLTL